MQLHRSLELTPARVDIGVMDTLTAIPEVPMDIDRLYAEHATYVFNVCHGILGNPDDARDATQETFIKLMQALPRFRGQGSVAGWIYRIAVNTCLDLLRKRRSGETPEALDWMPAPERSEQDCALEERVRATILRLKPAYRVVLVLFYFQEMSCDEIARCLRCTTMHIRVRLHRARKAFHQQYGAGGDDHVL